MKDCYIERMKTELSELSEKVNKLDCFVHTNKFYELSPEQRGDLDRQLWSMREYRKVLSERIAKADGINLYPEGGSVLAVSSCCRG